MCRYFTVFFLILVTDFSFGQVFTLTQTHTNATIGLDRKAWAGLGNTSGHSDGYAHDFTLPARTSPCQQITSISVVINLTGYTNPGGPCPHSVLYYNLFYGCGTYSGGATCLPATNLIAEPNFPPNTSPPPFNFGNPLGGPVNPGIVPDFGGNLSVDIIPVSNPGCNPVTNGQISYQYTITVTVTVTLNTPVTPALTSIGPFCASAAPTALNTTQSGIPGSWSGPGVSGNSFNPATAGAGNHTLTFTPNADQCANVNTTSVTVNAPSTPALTSIGPFCISAASTALNTTQSGITGNWSGPGVAGNAFNPATAGAGNHTLTFSPNAGQCAIANTISVTVNAATSPALTPIGPFCVSAASTALNTTQSGITGNWAGPGVVGNAFNPATAGAGNHTLTFSPDAGQCAIANTISVTVNAATSPALTPIGPFCVLAASTALNTTQSGITGNWSGPGVAGNAFNPATAGAGNHTLTFSPDAGQCAIANTISVTVNAATSPALTPIGPFCVLGAATTLNTTQSGITGNWSGPGVAGNAFNPATAGAGNHTLTFSPDAGQCAIANTISVTVNAATSPALTPIGPFCASAAPTALNTTQSGITGNWSGPGVAGNTFNPATAGAGNHTLTFSPNAGQCAIANTISVTVNPNPTANVPAPFEVCVLFIPPTLLSENSAVVLTQITGGNPGLTVNWFFDAAATMPIPNINNIFLAIPPPTTVYATVSNGSCSSATVPVGIIISQPPVINPPSNVSACQSYTLPPITGANLTGNEAYYTGPNGTGTQFMPGQVIASTITLFAYDGSGNCADQEQFSITITPPPTANPPGAPLSICDNGAGLGQFNLANLDGIISGGSGTVNWFSDAGATNPIANPSAFVSGTATVYAVVSLNGCNSVPVPVSLIINPLPVANQPLNPFELCAVSGNSAVFNLTNLNGAISGGSGAVNWFSNPAGTISISNPTAYSSSSGTVYATVSNGNCTSLPVPVSLQVNPLPVVNLTVTQAISCAASLNGAISTGISGATGPFTFDWNINALDGQQNPANLGPGTYSVVVTATNTGCMGTGSITLSAPALITLNCAQQNPVSAIGAADGSATVQISGGTAAYTVAWSGAASGSQMQATAGTATITGLIAGNYNIIVTDANGCTQTCSFTIASPNCNLSANAVGTNPGCNGAVSGSIELTVTGGTGALTFDWNSNTLDGTEDPTGLVAGTYSVTVTDGAGCTANTSVTLTDPAALVLVCAQQNPVSAIGAADGSATVQISGGTASYTVAWSGAASGSQTQAAAGTATITGLIAGNYNIIVTDDNGCTQTCAFTIAFPNCNLSANAVGTNPGCNGAASGSIALTVTGGTGTLTFDWNNNTLDGAEDPTGLVAGTYAVTVTDGAGCTANTSVTLTDPMALVLVCAQQNPVSAIGAADGSATVQISGGTAAYTVAWSGAASGSQMQATAGTATITGLIAGNYNIIVTDDNGCTQTCSFSITSPNCNLSANAVGTNPGCNGAASGSIALTVTGGTGTLTFDWDNNTLDGTEDPTGLVAGTYAVTVTDGAGCTANTSVTLTDPMALVLVCAQQNPVSAIGAADGSATVQISGGTAAYSVAWSGAASGSQTQAAAGTATITGLIAGNYNIIVTDDNGCTQTCSFSIASPNCNLSATAAGTNPGCNGAASGSIDLTVTGGTGALTFDWNNNTLDGTEDPTGLVAGTYSVTVTDGAGCTANASVTLTDPAALVLVCAQQNPVSAIGGADGSATVQISGGTAAYTVAWSGAANGSQNQAAAGTATITGLIAGNYNIIVTDANGCTQTCAFTIASPNCNLSATAVGTNPGCNGAASGSIDLTATGGTGTLTFDWNNNTLDGTEDPTGLVAGTYAVTVTDGAGCTANTSVTLTDPMALVLVCAQQNPVSAIGAADGSATVQISGGTAAYSVAWSGAASGSQTQAAAGTATITGLIAGNYNIIVTDDNGCTQTCAFTITSPNCNLSATAVGTNPGCNGAASGSIDLTVTGGTGTLTFDWNNNTLDGTEDPTGLVAGTYSVTVTDGAGCTANTSVTLTDPMALVLVCAQQNPVSAIGAADGSATVQISGGTAAYTVAWSGAASGSQTQAAAGTATITGLIAGNYNIIVTDDNGCTQTCSFTITSPNCNLSATAVGTNPGCNGAASGSIDLTVTGGTGTLTFDWNNNTLDGTEDPTGLVAGTYAVTVTDGAGCTTNTSVTLTNPAALVLVCAQQNPVSVIGAADGSATVQISGGTAAYTVAWSGAASGSQTQAAAGTATITGLIAGNYNIIVTDDNGCTQTCSFTITSPNCNLSATAVGTNPGCNGAASGSIYLTVTGGTGTLTFDWDNNTLDGTEDPTGLVAGTYAVTVTDGAGCTANTSVTLTDPTALSFAATGNMANCLDPLNGSISITLANGGTSPYEVSYDGLLFTGLGSLPSQIAGVAPGNYTVTLQDANDCMVETQVVVLAAPTYTLDLGPDRNIRLGDSIRLEGLANFNIDSVVWTPTEFLNDITGPVTFARPRVSTVYQLTAFDENGCRAEDGVWVFVEQKYEIFVPNVFSPNGDGINDKFRIFGDDKVKTIRNLQIFDRWGGNVFGVTNVMPDASAAGWDGSHRGQPVSAGVYLYFAEIEFFDDHVETVTGEVTVVR